jgi:ribosomal protein L40E
MRALRQAAFRSKTEAMNRRVQSWFCLSCDTRHWTKPKICKCGSTDLHYFPSEAEARRFAALKLELRCGLISDLELQPEYHIVMNGVKITTYRADFRYTKDGSQVVEDVKGSEKHATSLFKLKRKMVEAEFGIRLLIT